MGRQRKLIIDPSKNHVIWGDNKEWLKYIPTGSVNLIYIDPPFFSNRKHEVLWGNGFELRSYGDRWKGGLEHYISWMRERLIEAKRVLHPKGSIFLHCDYRANYRLRMLLNELFGEKIFLNEIIWSYDGLQSPSKIKLSTKNDSILRYAKDIKNVKVISEELYYFREISNEELKAFRKDKHGYFYDFARNDYTNKSIKQLEKQNRVFNIQLNKDANLHEEISGEIRKWTI